MYKIVKFENEQKHIEDFLKLPSLLYDKKHIVQNKREEEKILSGNHELSKYFSLYKYLCYDEKDSIVARAIVTMYPNKDEAYIGFFESFDNVQAVREMFSFIEEDLKKLSIKKIIGPVDSSFWIGYRLKIDNFDKEIYVGEPYNKEYYYNLFLENGYIVDRKWVSNIYEIKNKNYNPIKYKERYEEFSKKGYKIVYPRNKKEFETAFECAYKLIMELYKDFPVFKNVSEKDYYKYYSFYSVISNYKLLKVAYYNNEAVGFFIGIPNYKNLLYSKLDLLTKLKMLYIKKNSTSFVAQYIGVKKEHRGLGKAIIYTILQEAKKCNGKIIGALIEENKETESYFDDVITDKYSYVLMEKLLGE